MTFELTRFDAPLLLPVLRGGPVVLRPFDADDVALVVEASRDPYIPAITSLPADATDAEARSFIDRQQKRAVGGHGYSLAVATAEDERRGIGAVGLWLRDIEQGRATAGYWLLAPARGHGLAAEALRVLTDFAFGQLAIPRVQLYIEPWNVASARTATAAGFTLEARLRGWERIGDEQHDADCYSQLREEWAAR
jgi:ribosomal-protein-alanine N-acetyltransferase